MSEKNIYTRYQKQLRLDGFGKEAQDRLMQAKVLMIGAGGLGCAALQYIVAAGVGCVGIVDFDKVELGNLHRQVLYTHDD
ncbi:MAG: ThiF family adenylyltransferase, partial [Bacteroidetes bacterium]|nr:ThiF family adenylyltransferase [Bacteroidota bacterium]